VSFQITVLKVLSGHPGGCLSVDDLKRAVAILMTSGLDWTERTKRLLARAPGLDIFSQALVTRDDRGWQITDAGRALLAAVENPGEPPVFEPLKTAPASEQPTYSTTAPLPMNFVGRRQRNSRRRRRVGRSSA
jgi:hypothetical protein